MDSIVSKSLSQQFEKNLMGVYVNVVKDGAIAVGNDMVAPVAAET